MAPSIRDWTFVGMSVTLGVYAFVHTNAVASDFVEPVLAACQAPEIAPEDFASTTGFHAYDPRVGPLLEIFVCLITQFFADAATHSPGGTLVGMGTFCMILPIVVAMGLEAGRSQAWGPIRYPMVMLLIYQLVGAGVGFPLLWIPSYILFRGSTGGIATPRVYLSVLPAMASLIMATLVFWLSPDTALWTTCAGILGGPGLCLTFVPVWLLGGRAPPPEDVQATKHAAEQSTMAYATVGAMALFTWLWVIAMVVVPEVGMSPMGLYHAVWGHDATGPIRFLCLDMMVLWLSCLLFIGYQKETAALEAFGLSFMFGPGAGIALVFAGLQVDDDATPSLRAIKPASSYSATSGKKER